MSPSALKAPNKHQARTEETQAKILIAAEAIFSEQGFEKPNSRRWQPVQATLAARSTPTTPAKRISSWPSWNRGY